MRLHDATLIRLEAEREAKIKSLEEEVERLRVAATALYRHRWVCGELQPGEQAALWESLRDALGITPGTATVAGVGANPQPTLTDAQREVLERLASRLNDMNMDDAEDVVRGLLERLH